MSRFIYLFDLDATLTKQEIFPAIAKEFGLAKKINGLPESTVKGEVPFKTSFLQSVSLLRDIQVSRIRELVGEIALNGLVAEFIRKYAERCYIVTGHLDIWIEDLMKRIGMEKKVFCSKAFVKNDRLQDVFSIVDKNAVASQMPLPFVAVGDGNNDAEMIEAAEVGIGYGGVRDIAPSVLACASHAIYQEERLAEFLEKLL